MIPALVSGARLFVQPQEEMSWSVVEGILTADAGSGSGEINIRWDRATTYTNAAWYADPKTHRLYVGTSEGGSQVIDGADLSTTPQPGATHVRVTGLTPGTTYYARATAIASSGNESSVSSEQSFVAAVPPSLPGSWTDISSTTTISSSGNYRITSSFTGTIRITASNVLLHGQGNTITHSEDGIRLGSGVSNVEIRNIVSAPTAACRFVAAEGNLGAGCSMHHCTVPINYSGGRGVSSYQGSHYALGGMRIYANTVSIVEHGGSAVGFITRVDNFRAYGNTCVVASGAASGQRSAFVGEANAYENWGNHYTLNSGLNCSFDTGYTQNDRYIHDNYCEENGGDENYRLIHGDGDLRLVVLYNTLVQKSSGTGRAMRFRAADNRSAQNLAFGYNLVDNSEASTNPLMWYGDTASGGGSYTLSDVTFYHNASQNIPSGVRLLAFYGGAGFDNLTTWHNQFRGQNGNTVTGAWAMNHEALPEGVANTRSDWEEFNCTIGGSQGNIVTQGSWVGFNPASYTPSAPTNVRTI